jgi:hypothetical protein
MVRLNPVHLLDQVDLGNLEFPEGLVVREDLVFLLYYLYYLFYPYPQIYYVYRIQLN